MAIKPQSETQRPTAERVRELLRYDPETGNLYWRMTGKGRPRDLSRPAGSVRKDGYLAVCVDYNLQLIHRLVWLYVHGEWPENEVDHINLVRADNRIVNLRAADRAQNNSNSRCRKKREGLKGTHRNGKYRWAATITVNRKSIFIGNFPTTEEAHAAYIEYATKVWGEFANAGHSSPLAAQSSD